MLRCILSFSCCSTIKYILQFIKLKNNSHRGIRKINFQTRSSLLLQCPSAVPFFLFWSRRGRRRTLTRTRCVQTVATVVFMEMNRGSLNPLFVCRLPPLPSYSTYSRYLHLGVHPRARRLFPLRSRASSALLSRPRPCRFARFILLPLSRALLSPIPSSRPTTVFFLVSRARGGEIHARSCRRCLPT